MGYQMKICDLVQDSDDDICLNGDPDDPVNKKSVLQSFYDGERSCGCNVGCDETVYEVKISSSLLPSKNDKEDSVVGADVTTSESGFQDDSAEIGVYFQSLSTKMISEEPKLKLTGSMIHAVGGSLS